MKTDSIEGARLRLRPFDVERHLTARYVGWLNDPAVVRYSEQRHVAHTIESCRRYVESFRGTPSRLWALELKADGTHIGNLSAYIDGPNRIAELAILIGAPGHGGRGLGTEAWSAALAWLLRDAGMRKVHAGTMADNRPMVRIFEKTGMQIEGMRRRHYLLEGREVDVVVAAIFARP